MNLPVQADGARDHQLIVMDDLLRSVRSGDCASVGAILQSCGEGNIEEPLKASHLSSLIQEAIKVSKRGGRLCSRICDSSARSAPANTEANLALLSKGHGSSNDSSASLAWGNFDGASAVGPNAPRLPVRPNVWRPGERPGSFIEARRVLRCSKLRQR